jgi:hypothetical protein
MYVKGSGILHIQNAAAYVDFNTGICNFILYLLLELEVHKVNK